MRSFKEHQARYRLEHTTLGCKVMHMIGVPTIVLSLPMVLFDWRWGIAMFVFGWFCQFIGHFVFEKNKPMVFEDPKDPYTYFAAVIFVGQEWLDLFTGRFFRQFSQKKDKVALP